MTRRGTTGLLLMAAAALAVPAQARADIVRFPSGQVMSVRTVAYDGDIAVLSLRSGGEVRLPRASVAEVLPDEVPYPDPKDLVVPPAPPPVPDLLVVTGDAIHALVDRLAAQFGVDLKLARAVIQVESNFQARARSPKGAMGLMQIMPVVANTYALLDPFDPEQNLSAGLQHLRRLLGRFDVPLALAAYNAGEGAVERYKGIPPYAETRDYVRRVMALAK